MEELQRLTSTRTSMVGLVLKMRFKEEMDRVNKPDRALVVIDVDGDLVGERLSHRWISFQVIRRGWHAPPPTRACCSP